MKNLGIKSDEEIKGEQRDQRKKERSKEMYYCRNIAGQRALFN